MRCSTVVLKDAHPPQYRSHCGYADVTQAISADVLDDLDQLVEAVALLAGEVDWFRRSLDRRRRPRSPAARSRRLPAGSALAPPSRVRAGPRGLVGVRLAWGGDRDPPRLAAGRRTDPAREREARRRPAERRPARARARRRGTARHHIRLDRHRDPRRLEARTARSRRVAHADQRRLTRRPAYVTASSAIPTPRGGHTTDSPPGGVEFGRRSGRMPATPLRR
jgi:hypothetical protein